MFRTVEGLQQKAGVTADRLRRLVLKELCDNGLDTGTKTRAGQIDDDGRFFVEDDGPGLDGSPEEIAELFSIRRPMRSTKLLRKPQRGALGNGLRVVAGAVLASEGTLAVVTRNRRIELQPKADGSTGVASVKKVDHPLGTRVEVGFGAALPDDDDNYPLVWAQKAMMFAGGNYDGASSAYWYDAAGFHELLLAGGGQSVRSLVAQLDGCSGGKAGEIVAAARLGRKACHELTRAQATQLLQLARSQTRPVSADRLGTIGRQHVPESCYAVARASVAMGHSQPQAEIPFVVEAWAAKTGAKGRIRVTAYINRTPSVDDVTIWHDDDKDLYVQGSGLSDYGMSAPKTGAYMVALNVTAPYIAYTSDGKAPDLGPFSDTILATISAAMRKAQRAAPSDNSQHDDDDLLPRKQRGQPDTNYRKQVIQFCALITSINKTMDFKVGSRGWCYILERHGLRKGSFDAAEKLITACRKSGDLPLDICSEDVSRETLGIEQIDQTSVAQQVEYLITDLRDHAHERYTPISFWDEQGLDVYVEVVVEKLDLRNLFWPVCRELHVKDTNLKGWSDVNARANLMLRFKQHDAAGRRGILLVCVDHDPGGLHIAEKLRKNLQDLSEAVDWDPTPDKLEIIRFGLNADFIDRHGLTWIDNLETSSGGQLDDKHHPDHDKRYVQDYIDEFGVRKCEANALVVVPEVGRQLVRDAILRHVPDHIVERYRRKLARIRKRLQTAIRRHLSDTPP